MSIRLSWQKLKHNLRGTGAYQGAVVLCSSAIVPVILAALSGDISPVILWIGLWLMHILAFAWTFKFSGDVFNMGLAGFSGCISASVWLVIVFIMQWVLPDMLGTKIAGGLIFACILLVLFWGIETTARS